MDDRNDHEGPTEPEHAACEQCSAGGNSALFTWSGLAAWSADCLILGALTAWLAFTVQTSLGFAPLLLFPVLAGGLLGGLLAGARLLTPIGQKPTILAGVLFAVVIAVSGQHVLSYRSAVRQWEEDRRNEENRKNIQLAEAAFPDLDKERLRAARPTFWKFMRGQAAAGRPIGNWLTLHGTAVWISWAIDAAILGVAAFSSNAIVFRRFWRGPEPEENMLV